MKKILLIIAVLFSFVASAQIRTRDSTVVIRHDPPLNTLIPTYSFITPFYKQVMARYTPTTVGMMVYDTVTGKYGWQSIGGGGGATSPGGSNTQFQYNNAGSFGGVSALTWNGTNLGIALGSDATGDLYRRNSSGFLERIPIGTTKQKLGVVGGLPTWMDTTASGGIALTDTYVGVGNGSTISGTANLTHTYASNVSTLKVRAGSSQSTNDLQQWNANDNTARLAVTSDYRLKITQTGGGYDQYLSVGQINSLPGSFKFESYSGDYWGTNVNSTDIKFMASGSQTVSFANPVLVASGTANPFKVTGNAGVVNLEALQYGGISLPTAMAIGYIEKTGTYTATTADHVINCTSGTFTVTLPLANTKAGLLFTIINSGAGAITVGTTSSQTINGSTTYSLPAQYDWVTVISDGVSKWYIKSKTGGSGGTTRIDQLLAATATNTINNVAYNQEWEWNSLATGAGLSLSSTSTAASSNPTLLSVGVSGTNASASKTTYASSLYNIHTGTTSTNIGQDILVENGTTNIGLQVVAQGGTNNYAALFGAGNVGIGEATPTAYLHLGAATATAGTGQLKFNSSTLPTTPEVGLMNMKNGLWFIDSSNSNRDTIATREWTSTYVGTDTTRIVTGPTGYTATAYSPRSTFMYEKAVRYTIGDSVVHSDRITTTDSTASFDLPTYMPVQVIGTSGTNATTDLATYTTPSGYIGVYEIGLKIKPTAVSGGVLTTVVTYQDDVNATVTYTMITTGALSTLTTTGTFHYPTIQIAAYADSEIKITSTLTVGTMTYNAYGTITYVRKVPILP